MISTPPYREYSISKRWAIIAGFWILISLAVLICSIIGIFYAAQVNGWLTLIPIFLIILFGAALYSWLEAYTSKLLINENEMQFKNVFKIVVFTFREIKGFRAYIEDYKSLNYNHTIIITSLKGESFEISKYTEQSEALRKWLAENFIDLDVQNYQEELDQIIGNSKLEDNQANLQRATLIARAYNILCILIAISLFFISNQIMISIALAFPLLCIPIVYYFKGLVTYNNKSSSPRPFITIGLFISSPVLAVHSISLFSLMGYGDVWIPALTVWIVLSAVVLASTKEFDFKKGNDLVNAAAIVLILFPYCYGAFILSNCSFDDKQPESIKVAVKGKEKKENRYSYDYDLMLDKWGPMDEKDNYEVCEDMYNQVQVGDTVVVNLKPGLWNKQWYYISLKERTDKVD